jgi:hypothetical protein
MNNSLLLWLGGIFNLGFFIFHIFFWKMFGWKDDLKKLHPINRAVMQVLNLCLMFYFLIFAYVSLFLADQLQTTILGLTLIFSIAMFWAIRAILQYVFFSRTRMVSHILFVIFVIGCLLYLIPWLRL